MDDIFYACLYCGELMTVSEKALEIFGHPDCCDTNMCLIDYDKVILVIRNLDILKENLEAAFVKEFE